MTIMLKDSIGTIEYLGFNVQNGSITNVKKYYKWDNRSFPISNRVKCYLKPFDFGIRELGATFSISSFIVESKESTICTLCQLISEEYGILIPAEFPHIMSLIQQPDYNIHYDPILSFKFNEDKVTGASFYVTALKDKSKIVEYKDIVQKLVINKADKVSLFITSVVNLKYADMFQVSWDYSASLCEHNKVYVKIKNRDGFLELLSTYFPEIMPFTYHDGFRFCELAFTYNNDKHVAYNLYFKPL